MRKTIVATLFILIVASLATAAALAQNAPQSTVIGIAISSSPSATSTYGRGETISVQATFSLGPVTIASGTPPYVAMTVGSSTRQAVYASGSGTGVLTFSYTVQAGDLDADGVSIPQGSIQGIIWANTNLAVVNSYGAITNASGHKVNGGPLPAPPAFPANAAVEAQTYTKSVSVRLQLPETRTGSWPVTYTLTGPTSSPQLPAGLIFNTSTKILSGTPTGWQDTIRYTYTVTDANGRTASLPVDITVNADFDADDDQLIEVHNLAQLNAIRWDLNGDGDVSAQTATIRAQYRAVYPGVAGMGCKAVDHDNSTTTPNQPVCVGYELNDKLDFDTDGDGATYTITSTSTGAVAGDSGDSYYNGGQGWTPIGDEANPFTGDFEGNDKTIGNLFINSAGTNALVDIGLFGYIGKCDTGGDNCQGEVRNLGLLDAKITRNHSSLGNVGTLAGRLNGVVTGSYADGSSVDYTFTGSTVTANTAGGLIGAVKYAGKVTGSYAKVNVTGRGTNRILIGGLAGRSSGTITVSYATGDVRNTSISGPAGGLVGTNLLGGAIIASYAAGSVSGGYAGGLVGLNGWRGGTITASYAMGKVSGISRGSGLAQGDMGATESYWDAGGTGFNNTSTRYGVGKATTELQSPTSTVGIYSTWNAGQWDFGDSRQYPAVKHNGKLVLGQRETSIRSDNPHAPVVGEPVVARLNVTGATSTVWQWQSSAGGAAWSDIAGARAATYIPTTTDVGKHLRAKVTFTALGRSRTVITFNTAKAVAAPSTTSSDAVSFIPVIGSAKIRFSLSASGSATLGGWRWKRCDDAAMQTGCKFVTSSEPASNAYTEYTPAAGSDTDVGKYLQAYVYYADSGNGNAWTRGETPVLGPVAAAGP